MLSPVGGHYNGADKSSHTITGLHIYSLRLLCRVWAVGQGKGIKLEGIKFKQLGKIIMSF